MKIKLEILLFIIIGILVQQTDTQAYKQNEFWKEYRLYNEARTSITDYKNIDYEGAKIELDELGISENDLRCINNWIFADKHTYSIERLEKLNDINKISMKMEWNPVVLIKSMLKQKYNYCFGLLVALIVLLAEKNKTKGILAVAFNTYILIMALYFRNRPVERVMIPIYFVGMLIILAYSFLEQEKIGERIWKKITMYIVLIIIMVSFIIRSQNTHNDKLQARKKYEATYKYIQNNREFLFVGSGGIINNIVTSTPYFELNDNVNIENLIKLGTWDIYSSRYYHQVETYDIVDKDSLLLSLMDKMIIYVADESAIKEMEMIKTYIEEHTLKQVNVNVVHRIKAENVLFYRIELCE